MARIFITGSADGLGLLGAKALVKQGHKVVLHARNSDRGRQAQKNLPDAENIFTGDLSSIEETKKLAEELNESGVFDAVIHNAGVYQVSAKIIFAVNTLAPYILTCLMQKPKRLIYLSSGMHLQGRPNFEEFSLDSTRITYSDSKLHVLILSMAVGRKWSDVYSNAIDPGWVPTRMGGKGAPDGLQEGYETQVWLAVSNDAKASVSGRYFHHQKEEPHNPAAINVTVQENFLELCQDITGVSFPNKT
ncbi:MAG TPA: SDR family NAD(P)-dependent oxidoreductase [Chryseosolibacter sp.]